MRALAVISGLAFVVWLFVTVLVDIVTKGKSYIANLVLIAIIFVWAFTTILTVIGGYKMIFISMVEHHVDTFVAIIALITLVDLWKNRKDIRRMGRVVFLAALAALAIAVISRVI